ncbi:AMP-dependent synthetase [Rhodovulum sp. 12E13]|uniref:AMP-binding protein n=1 Tax=Rhodovulum sp. 12E13 TaxID=2203891 RepID=UPI000E16E60C|nr:AMP-binding protein [Rhodovulum sp. 12E13]RDC71932.1 AMP-dependent synthetase [Rhodovulum sp. 12E13]
MSLPPGHPGALYPRLAAGEGWRLPARLNMAEEACDRWAEADPDRPAILEPAGGELSVTTYGQLRAMADALARALAAQGVGRGDRVGVLRAQSPWTAAAHVAIWKLGAISIPLFVLFGDRALAERLSDSSARAVVADPESAARLSGLAAELPDLADILVPEEMDLRSGGPPMIPAATGPDDPAVLIYTSGTTGGPKGALHGHRVLRGHLPGVEMSHDLLPRAGDVLWTPADWAWIGGLFDVLMPGLFHGVPVVAARLRKFTPEGCIEVVRSCGVRNVFFPPTALRALRAADLRLPGLRSVASGGEPLGAEMLAWGRRAFGLTINEFYGQTECNMVVSSCAALFEAVPGAMGRAVPGHEVAVIDAEGRPTEGEGDIAVRRGSASMFLGYWNDPQATAARFRCEWMLTGDRGLREGAALRFVGREDDIITSSGYRIGPGEVEDCLLTHAAVASAGVVGTPDAARTEAVTAFVVLREGHPPSEALRAALQSHVREHLGAHEYPRLVHFVEDLPMTVTGKVIRRALRARAAELAEEEA